MRARILIFLVMFTIAFRADAQALPAFTGAVNKALGKVIEKTAIRRGFAANDPRMLTTYNGASTIAAGVAAQMAVSAATAASAPIWLTAAAGLGAAAVVGGLAYGIYKIFFDDSTSEAGFVVKSTTGGGYMGTPWVPSGNYVYVMPNLTFNTAEQVTNSTKDWIPAYSLYFHGVVVYGDDFEKMMQMAVDGWIALGGGTGAKFKGCDPMKSNAYGGMSQTCRAIRIGSGGNTQPEDTWMAGEYSMDFNRNNFKPAETFKGTVNDIVPKLSATELARPADPATIAQLANGLWERAAAQPGYEGIPYSASDPVTVADAVAVQQYDPSSWPKNADLAAPVAPAAGQTPVISPVYDPVYNPTPLPGTATPTPTNPTSPGVGENVNVINTPNVNVANKVQIDFGADPAVGAPTLEPTPTAQAVLSPLFNLMPSLQNFVVPSHQATCPSPDFTMFDKTMVMDGHCKLLEPVRPTLYAVMAFVWLMLGTVIILRA